MEAPDPVNDSIISAGGDYAYQLAVCVRSHQATDSNQLQLQVNDRVCVLEKDETGWWGGHKEKDEFTGWFPGACVMEIIDESPQNFNPEAPTMILKLETIASTYSTSGGEITITCTNSSTGARMEPLDVDPSSTTLGQIRRMLRDQTAVKRIQTVFQPDGTVNRQNMTSLKLARANNALLDPEFDSVPIGKALQLTFVQAPQPAEEPTQVKLPAPTEPLLSPRQKEDKQHQQPNVVETSHSGQHSKRGSAVASPQHANSSGWPSAGPADELARAAEARAAAEEAAAKAQSEATRLQNELKDLQRGQDAERRAREAAEAKAQALERQVQDMKRERVKHEEALRMAKEKQQVDDSDWKRRAAAAEQAKDHAEKERRSSQARYEELQRQREQDRDDYIKELKAREDMIKKAQESEKKWNARISQAEDRTRRLEEELREEKACRASCGSTTATTATIATTATSVGRETRGSIGSVSGRGGVARGSVGSVVEATGPDIPVPRAAVPEDDNFRRRLFPSTASVGQNGTPRRGDDAEFPLAMTPQPMTSPTAPPSNTRGPPPIPTTSPQGVPYRSSNPQTVAGPKPNAQARAESGTRSESATRQAFVRSGTEEIAIGQFRAESRGRPGATDEAESRAPQTASDEEPPPVGSVLNKIRQLEQRFSSPRRSGSETNVGGSSSRAASARRAPSANRGPPPQAMCKTNNSSPPRCVARAVTGTLGSAEPPMGKISATIGSAPLSSTWASVSPAYPATRLPQDAQASRGESVDKPPTDVNVGSGMSPLTRKRDIRTASPDPKAHNLARVPLARCGAPSDAAAGPAPIEAQPVALATYPGACPAAPVDEDDPPVSVKDRIKRMNSARR